MVMNENNQTALTIETPTKTLAEEMAAIVGIKKKFLLYRIGGLNVEQALAACSKKIGSYTLWLTDPDFIRINNRRQELELVHRNEAVKLLRRENQLGAVLIEERIILEIQRELEDYWLYLKDRDDPNITPENKHKREEFILIKTPLARAVYDKLIQDIDAMPSIQIKKLSFADKMAVLLQGINQPVQLGTNQVQGNVVEGAIVARQPDQS